MKKERKRYVRASEPCVREEIGEKSRTKEKRERVEKERIKKTQK